MLSKGDMPEFLSYLFKKNDHRLLTVVPWAQAVTGNWYRDLLRACSCPVRNCLVISMKRRYSESSCAYMRRARHIRYAMHAYKKWARRKALGEL